MMRTKNLPAIGLLACILSLFLSCASQPSHENHKSSWKRPSRDFSTWLDYVKNFMPPEEKAIMPYRNLYKDSPDLAGIEVYQKPVVDNATSDYSEYIGKHPGTVCYHFWNGKIYWLYYSPEGKIISKEWGHHAKDEESEYFNSWEMVDFNKGSDPHFKSHHDPRKNPASSLFPPVS